MVTGMGGGVFLIFGEENIVQPPKGNQKTPLT